MLFFDSAQCRRQFLDEQKGSRPSGFQYQPNVVPICHHYFVGTVM